MGATGGRTPTPLLAGASLMVSLFHLQHDGGFRVRGDIYPEPGLCHPSQQFPSFALGFGWEAGAQGLGPAWWESGCPKT